VFDGAVVAIEAPGPPAPEYLASAVSGCASALGQGRCIEVAAITGVSPEWRAIVRASSMNDPRVMVIEVRRNGALFRRRILHFTDRDAVDTRWSTAGAVVAAVISGQVERQRAEQHRAVESPESEPETGSWSPNDYSNDPIDAIDEFEAAGPPLFEIRQVSLELSGTSGVEVYQGPLKYGGLVQTKLLLSGGPFVFVGAGSSAFPENPLIVQTDGFVGLGLPYELSHAVGIDVGASFLTEWLWLRHRATSGRTDSANTWRVGAGLDADVRLRLTGSWAVVVGGRATFLQPEVDIRRPPRQLAIVLPAGLGLLFGVRYDFMDGSR
jgi:hypothetical protein